MQDQDERGNGFLTDVGFTKRAKLEINVNEHGVNFVANAEGYLALARFCTLMAEIHTDLREEAPDFQAGAYHLGDYVSDEAVREGRFMFSPGPLRQFEPEDPLVTQDILFSVSDTIGPEYWGASVDSGPSDDWVKRFEGPMAPVDFNLLAKELISGHKALSYDELTQLFNEQASSALGPAEKFTGHISQHEETVYSVVWELERDETLAVMNSFYFTEEDEEPVVLEVVEDDD